MQAEAKYPEPPSGASAIDGTHTHTLLDHVVKAGLADPMAMIGVKMKDHEGEFVIDAERAERVKFTVDHIKSRVATHGGNCQVIAERKVNPEWLVGRKDMKGTADITIVSHATRTIEIWDLKDGFDPVDATDNEQLEVYAVGALAELRLAVNVQYPFDVVVMGIIQPKLRLKGLNPISSSVKSVQHILGLPGRMALEAHLTEQPDAKLVPGEKQCKYCRAAGCEARMKAALEGVGIVQSMQQVPLMFPSLVPTTQPAVPAFLQQVQVAQPVAVPAFLASAMPTGASPQVSFTQVADVTQQAAGKDPTKMSNEELVKVYEATGLLKQLIKNTEEEMLRRLKAGIKIDGYKAVHGRGSRSWSLPEEEMVKKLIGMGIPKSYVYETSLLSPAKAEKLVWEKVSKGETVRKQLTERQIKTMDKEFVVHSKGALTVAPETDERPSAIIDAAPMFSAVTAPAVPQAATLPSWLK